MGCALLVKQVIWCAVRDVSREKLSSPIYRAFLAENLRVGEHDRQGGGERCFYEPRVA
jgi:hypothetical protein